MNRKKQYAILAAESVLPIVLCVLQRYTGAVFPAAHTHHRRKPQAARHDIKGAVCTGITEVNLSILCGGRAKGIRFAAINKICCCLGCNVGGEILKFDGVLEAE